MRNIVKISFGVAAFAAILACGTPSNDTQVPPAVQEPETVQTATAPAPAGTTIEDGTWTVGVDLKAGKYRVTANVSSDCYWAIYKSGTNGENIIANDIPGGGRPTVTLKVGQDFNTSNCGTWKKI